MKIKTYRDLKSKDELLPLMDQAFRWPFNPRVFESLVKIDPELKDGPVGFCAIENGHIVGFVGVLNLATKTLSGEIEHVGGIYGVATLPGYTRRGISTALMHRAHEYFKEKGYRFSFLNTSPTLIAYAFYKKLGYVDALEYPSVYKVMKAEKVKLRKTGKAVKLDFDKILRIYNKFSKDKTGFVVRDKNHLRALKKAEGLNARNFLISRNGYVVFKKDRNGVGIREIAALTTEETSKLIGLIENKTKATVYDRTVLDRNILQVYKSRGYIVQKRSHDIMMVKPLTAYATFKEAYGDRFYISGLDVF
ncbi:hypothetical protein DRO41_05425 [Candidatus Bathyarchaeota archaeon]|nr:MAG: hypothetical protein DRO41_05425 [Candidatus Bathyarchaeota archaeon]